MNDFNDFGTHEEQTIQSQPHNKHAEEAVLGSVLINPESFLMSRRSLKQRISISFAIAGYGKFLSICMKIRFRLIF
jgi:hypothetical protein